MDVREPLQVDEEPRRYEPLEPAKVCAVGGAILIAAAIALAFFVRWLWP